jgi:hypothetical protein
MSEADVSDDDHESLLRRLFLFAVGGALGGFVAAPLFLAPELTMRALDQRLSLMEFLELYSPFDKPFWSFVIDHLGAFPGMAAGGILIGILIGVFARGRRNAAQMLKIAIWSGSIYAAIAMISVLANQDPKGLILVLVFFVVGMVFGGATGFFAGFADKVLLKLHPQRTTETNQRSN